MQPFPGTPQRDSRSGPGGWSIVLAGIITVALLVGATVWAINYARTPQPAPAQARQSPTALAAAATLTSVPVAGTPWQGAGLNGPQPSVATATTSQSQPAASSQPDPEQTLRTIASATVPARDLYAIAERIKLKTTTPVHSTTGAAPGNYPAGHRDVFFLTDADAKRYYTTTATIRVVTDHAYWYVQDGQTIDETALQNASRTFETAIYPTDRAVFGSEWTPGVDNDPRITVLFTSIAGGIGGYYSSADEYTRTINPYSNQREMIYINIDSGWYGVQSTLAHEFQHMIHWHEHANHDIWVNEGSSELASALNGYGVSDVVSDFLRNPDLQLNAWDLGPMEMRPHYGAAFLFLDFLRQHYGGVKVINSLVSAPGEGIDAIDNALAETGSKARFQDVFGQWVVANLVDGQPGASQKGLDYSDIDVSVTPQAVAGTLPRDMKSSVAQYGAQYIEVQPPNSRSGSVTVDFKGQDKTGVISTPAHSGNSIWWSNRGDVADSTMTRRFDLTKVSSATLSFYLWYDTEESLDYGYVEASTDGGSTWDTLKGAYTSDVDPNGTNFGNGYSGKSSTRRGADQAGWLHEKIDLSRYAGHEIMVRFEYVTDDGYNAQGIAVDDISIPEIGFTDDAESDKGWTGAGFVRVANVLPQRYYLAAVKFKNGGFDVQPAAVDASGKVTFTIDGLGTTYSKAVLVVAGMTPYNLQRPTYELVLK